MRDYEKQAKDLINHGRELRDDGNGDYTLFYDAASSILELSAMTKAAKAELLQRIKFDQERKSATLQKIDDLNVRAKEFSDDYNNGYTTAIHSVKSAVKSMEY